MQSESLQENGPLLFLILTIPAYVKGPSLLKKLSLTAEIIWRDTIWPLLLYAGGAAMAVFVGYNLWRFAVAAQEYCATHSIITKLQLADLERDLRTADEKIESLNDDLYSLRHKYWTLEEKSELVSKELEKFKAPPASVVDAVVNAVVEEACQL